MGPAACAVGRCCLRLWEDSRCCEVVAPLSLLSAIANNASAAASLLRCDPSLMAHSIGSIREMVRQYREELSCQTASNNSSLGVDASTGRMLLINEEVACEKRVTSSNENRYAGTKRLKDKRPASVQKLYWHERPIGTACSPMQEKTGTCTPLRFRMDDLADFQDLDRRAAEVLLRSQQIIDGGQACKSSVALMSKRRFHLNHTQAPSYLPGNEHCSPHNSGSVERRTEKNQCRARDVVARNFEEIDKILSESNLIMEKSSTSDIQHKVSDFTKGGKETRQTSKESVFELRERSHGGVNQLKQDMEAREVAAIKAAHDYLNMDNGHSNILLSDSRKTDAEEVIATCRRLLNPNGGSVESAGQASCPSNFNTNKQQEWQTTMSLPFATLEFCNGTKACDKSMPTTSSVTQTNTAEIDRQCLHKGRHLNSGKVDFASTVASKGTWKYTDEFNIGESELGSVKSLDLDGRLSMSSRNFALTAKQRPSTVDTQQFPSVTKKKSIKKSSKIRDTSSIKMPVTSSGQEVGSRDSDLPASKGQSCTGRIIRGGPYGPACPEDGMKQLSTEDLLLTLENPRKVRASLRPSLAKDRRDTSCEGRMACRPEQYLSTGKCSTTSTPSEFESGHASSFGSGLDRNDKESTAHSAILASLEQDHEEVSGSDRYLLKSNSFQRNKVRHSELATQVLCSSTKCRGTKDKDNKFPAWMHSLNVRKPSKWRGMSITHTRMQASAATLIKGTVVVEELGELALHYNRPKDAILAAASNNNFKERGQEDLDYVAATVSIPNDNFVVDHCKRRQADHHFPASIYRKIIETRKADAPVSESIANGTAKIAEASTLSGQAGRLLEPSSAPCSDSYLTHRIHGSNGLPNGISLPGVLTVRENHRATSCFVTPKDLRFDNLPTIETTLPSGLDCLISEVVQEWVEVCSTSSPNFSAISGSQDALAVDIPVPTCSITDGGGTYCPAAEDRFSPGKRLKIANEMHVSETDEWSANQDLFRKMQGSKSLPRDSELGKVFRKNSVAALASVVQPLLAALQEAEIDETIVTEFEADETVRLLLEKLQFYETKIRALKNRRKGNFKDGNSAEKKI